MIEYCEKSEILLFLFCTRIKTRQSQNDWKLINREETTELWHLQVIQQEDFIKKRKQISMRRKQWKKH